MSEPFRYWAFISYSHYDRAWARWLHKRLETYRVPRRLVGQPHWAGERPRRLYPVFRDRDELPSSADLGGVVQRALRESRYLIVICSRHAAHSRWVNEEVETFKKLGRSDRILCLKIDEVDDSSSCFVPALLELYDAHGQPTGVPTEPLAADIAAQGDGRDGAVLKLIAGLLAVGYDELRRREQRRRLRQRIVATFCGAALVAAAAAGWRWQQQEKQEALAAQALTGRINRLYESGRTELLAHNEARAAVYLNEAYRLGIDTPALRFMLARAMHVVDAQQLRIQTGHALTEVDLSPDGKRAYGIGPEYVLHGYDVERGGAPVFDVPLRGRRPFLSGYSPGGALIWFDGESGTPAQRHLEIFDARNGTPLAQFQLRRNNLRIVQAPVADDDRHVAFVAPDASITVADLAGGAQRRIEGQYSAAAFCHDGASLIAGRSDGDVELRSAADGALRRRFKGAGGALTMLASSGGCELVAAGTIDGTIRVWDARSGAVLMSAGHRKAITDLQFSTDGNRLLSVSRGAAAIWNGRNGALLYASKYFGGRGNLVQMRPNGVQFAQLVEGRLAVLDAASGLESYTLDGHMGSTTQFRFARRASRLISVGSDGALVIWALPGNDETQVGSAPPGTAPAITFSADERLLFASDADGGGTLWQREPLQRLRRFATEQHEISVAAMSADRRWLATGSRDGRVLLSAFDSGEVVQRHVDVGGRPTVLQFDAGGRYLAADIDGEAFKLWDTRDGSLRLQYARGQMQVSAMAPHAARLAIAQTAVVRLRDLDSGSEQWSTSLRLPRDSFVTVLAYSADGARLLAATNKGNALVLDARDGRVLRELHDSSSLYFTTGAFAPDGAQIALGEWANSARLWRLADDRLLTLAGHTNPVDSASFGADGRFVLSAGREGAIRIWDSGSGELLDSFMAHDGAMQWNGARFTADGRHVLSSGRDGAARLWPVPQETRDAATLADVLACRTAWRAVGSTLVPSNPDVLRCAGRTAPGQ